MMTRVLGAAFLFVLVVLSGCSSVGGNSGAWEIRSDTIHVYVSGSRKPIEIDTTGQVITLIDAVFKAGQSVGDLRHVLVLRRAGAETIQWEVDVREMLLTGNAANNIQLEPGDLVRIVG